MAAVCKWENVVFVFSAIGDRVQEPGGGWQGWGTTALSQPGGLQEKTRTHLEHTYHHHIDSLSPRSS